MNARLRYVDIARGIGITLVVIGHSLVTPMRNSEKAFQAFYDGIYLFHMAFFFFLSGYLVSVNKKQKSIPDTKRSFLKKKIKHFIIPYLFYSLVGYGILGILSGRSLLQCIFEIVSTENHLFHHLWFLYTLFWVSVADYFIPEKFSALTMVAAAVLHGVFSAVVGLPLICLYLVRYLFFFEAGKLWGTKEQISYRFDFVLFMIMEILYIFLFSNPPAWTGILHIAERFLCSLVICGGGITASLLIIRLSVSMESWKQTGAAKIFEKFGNNSMEIYLLHMPLLVPGIGTILWKMGVNGALIVPVCTVIGILLPMFLAKYICKCKILACAMFGK